MSSIFNLSSKASPVGSDGECSETMRTCGEPFSTAAPPDPEVRQTPARRLFSAEYKRRILAECDCATQPGEVGAILRREGLFSFHLRDWRAAQKRAHDTALAPRQRGPKSARPTAGEQELKRLQRENARLQRKLQQAELIIELQKKVSELLGVTLPTQPSDDKDEENS